jgi:hypothetical protein
VKEFCIKHRISSTDLLAHVIRPQARVDDGGEHLDHPETCLKFELDENTEWDDECLNEALMWIFLVQ